ncbi:MAG: UGSC family (seleno)protein [Methanobacteriaceae archaeon]
MKVNIIEKEVLNPLGDTDTKKINLKPLNPNINVICYLDNTKPNADVILKTIQREIASPKSFKIIKPAGAPASNRDILRACKSDMVILAVGDCGSCSTWVILDAIKLERMGIPTISICSRQFSDYARMLAKSYGAPDLRIFDIEHPVAELDEEEIKLKVKSIIIKIKKLLEGN